MFCFLAKSHRRGEIVVFVEAEFEDPVVANRSCVGKVATLLSVNGDPVVFSFQMMLKRMYSKIAVGRADPPVLDELKVEFYKCEDKPLVFDVVGLYLILLTDDLLGPPNREF